jgi:hypothetical protein
MVLVKFPKESVAYLDGDDVGTPVRCQRMEIVNREVTETSKWVDVLSFIYRHDPGGIYAAEECDGQLVVWPTRN